MKSASPPGKWTVNRQVCKRFSSQSGEALPDDVSVWIRDPGGKDVAIMLAREVGRANQIVEILNACPPIVVRGAQ